jgi:hypothetical protein
MHGFLSVQNVMFSGWYYNLDYFHTLLFHIGRPKQDNKLYFHVGGLRLSLRNTILKCLVSRIKGTCKDFYFWGKSCLLVKCILCSSYQFCFLSCRENAYLILQRDGAPLFLASYANMWHIGCVAWSNKTVRRSYMYTFLKHLKEKRWAIYHKIDCQHLVVFRLGYLTK